MNPRGYVCSSCSTVYSANELIWRCSCGGHLDVGRAPGLAPDEIDTGRRGLWRYNKVLESPPEGPSITLGEGMTPLVPVSWEGSELLLKLDYLCPSGSFKDRGAAVMMNRLWELGVRSVAEDSSGNGGASIAAYSAAAGIDCTIFVPAHTSEGKVVQTRMYGAEVVKVPGSREDTAVAAQTFSAETGVFYASHNWHPLFVEGVKTVAYEIWEQLGFVAPDNVVAPAGFGSNVLGLYRGFSELLAAGQIARLPRIFAAQAANCAAIHDAWKGTPAGPRIPTIAEGVATSAPVRVPEILEALRESRGDTVAVSEEAIILALKSVGREFGLFVEPTTAVCAAAARQLCESGVVGPGEVTVAIMTGHGLKAVDSLSGLRPV
ncbi:MAG: hypothetical protein JWR35_3522 [Marmoricola sp.]|nr:hypothetical protein [Marmoricola sp.]